jgi:hypothetical protein
MESCLSQWKKEYDAWSVLPLPTSGFKLRKLHSLRPLGVLPRRSCSRFAIKTGDATPKPTFPMALNMCFLYAPSKRFSLSRSYLDFNSLHALTNPGSSNKRSGLVLTPLVSDSRPTEFRTNRSKTPVFLVFLVYLAWRSLLLDFSFKIFFPFPPVTVVPSPSNYVPLGGVSRH